MGYSCSANASLAIEMLMCYAFEDGMACVGTNGWRTAKDDFFYEIDRENHDGSITGTVYKTSGGRAGSFKVAADGIIERWAAMPKYLRDKVNQSLHTYTDDVQRNYYVFQDRKNIAYDITRLKASA